MHPHTNRVESTNQENRVVWEASGAMAPKKTTGKQVRVDIFSFHDLPKIQTAILLNLCLRPTPLDKFAETGWRWLFYFTAHVVRWGQVCSGVFRWSWYLQCHQVYWGVFRCTLVYSGVAWWCCMNRSIKFSITTVWELSGTEPGCGILHTAGTTTPSIHSVMSLNSESCT